MSLYRLWAILRKEFRHIRRDRRILFLVTLSPAIMLLTFAYLFALEVSQVRLGVWDMDRSALSRRYIQTLTADHKLVVTAWPTDYAALRAGLMSGEVNLGVVIPPGFEARLVAGETSPVQAIADGSDVVTSLAGLGRFRQRTAEFDPRLDHPGLAVTPKIVPQIQAWYNRDLDSMWGMVPALLAIVLILPSLAIALAVTRERELGSFETLIATPIHPVEYLLGKLIPYVTYGLISALVAALIAVGWFKVPIRGPVADLFILTLLYLLASLGESLLIASFLVSQGTAMRAILLIFLVPSIFLSGMILPVDTRSVLSQIIAFLLPATHFVQVTRGLFLKGMGLEQLAGRAVYLLAFGLVSVFLCFVTFRKQVD